MFDESSSRLPQPRKSSWRFVQRMLVLLLVALAIGTGWGLNYVRTVPALNAILPGETLGVVSLDARWLWDTSRGIRATPRVRKALAETEKRIGLSFTADVAPWIGETAFAALNVDKNADLAQSAVCVQVRDWPAFMRCLTRLQSATKKGKLVWTRRYHRGYRVESTKFRDEMKSRAMPVEITFVHGWFVAGIGATAIDKVIDAYAGYKPSLAANATWVQAQATVTGHAVLWGAFHIGNLFRCAMQFPSSPKELAEMKQGIDEFDVMALMGIADEGNGLRSEGLLYAGSAKARETIHSMGSDMPRVEGRLLARVPHAFAAFMINSPAQWCKNLKHEAGKYATTAQEKKELETGLAQIKPVEDVLNHYTGECGMAVTWDRVMGFGLVAEAQAADAATARMHAAQLASGIREWTGNVNSLPPAADRHVKWQPTCMAQDDWLVVTTHPHWTQPGTPGLQVPAEARSAYVLSVGNFAPWPSLIEVIEQAQQKSSARSDRRLTTWMRDLRLETAHWESWAGIAPDGSTYRQSTAIHDWNWRHALDATARAISATAAAPAKTHLPKA